MVVCSQYPTVEDTSLYIAQGSRDYSRELLMLIHCMHERVFLPQLVEVVMQDLSLFLFLIKIYLNKLVSASADVDSVISIFLCHAVQSILWFSGEAASRGLRSSGVLSLNEAQLLCETMLQYLQLDVYSDNPNREEYVEKLTKGREFLVKNLVSFMVDDLVEAAIISSDKVKIQLSVYAEYVNKSFVDPKTFIEIARQSWESKRQIFTSKLPCLAQVMANLGTGLISYRDCYEYGRNHIQISHLCFQTADNLLPEGVKGPQRDHLRKNIVVSAYVSLVLDAIIRSRENPASTTIRCFFGENADARDVCSAIKFVLQTVAEVKNPQGIQMVVETLRNLSRMFPELSSKCAQWESSATESVRVMAPAPKHRSTNGTVAAVSS